MENQTRNALQQKDDLEKSIKILEEQVAQTSLEITPKFCGHNQTGKDVNMKP